MFRPRTRIRSRSLLAALCCVAAAAAVAPGAAAGTTSSASTATAGEEGCPPAPAAVGGHGSDSGGDPYFPPDGNGGYDVRHYAVDVTYRPATDRLTGSTVLRAVATEALSSFDLDLVLTADRVRVDGVDAAFDQPSAHELRVTPATPLSPGDVVRVRVDYHGRPGSRTAEGMRPGSDLWFHGSGETIAMGEPQNGPWWFAADETPADKATFDVTVRVPQGVQAVGNGTLERQRSADGWTTRHWSLTDPVTTYLAFLAVGRFDVRTGTTDGLPHVYAVSRLLDDTERDRAFHMLRRTPAVVSWLAQHFGRYPFATTGGVVTGLRAPYALETATRPVYPYAGSGAAATELVVHEQAHQWFGDLVSVCRWADVWLNEGFATYAEWLWAAEHGGASVATALRNRYDAHPAGDGFWSGRLDDPGPAQMWDDWVYVRGAMTLAALRNVIGDSDMTTLLHRWATEQGVSGHGTTDQLHALAEQVSGQDLDGFFTAWLGTAAKPADTAANGLG